MSDTPLTDAALDAAEGKKFPAALDEIVAHARTMERERAALIDANVALRGALAKIAAETFDPSIAEIAERATHSQGTAPK